MMLYIRLWLKQSQQKINELLKQKDVLNEDVSVQLTCNDHELINNKLGLFVEVHDGFTIKIFFL